MFPEWKPPFASPLPLDADAGEWIEAHVLDPESHEFRHAQAAGDADMQHRAITDAHPRARIWRIKDGLHLGHAQVADQLRVCLLERDRENLPDLVQR